MLTIDRLRVSLPPELGPRAERIGRLLADELGRLRPKSSRRIARLELPPIHVAAESSDREIARRVARSLASRIDRRE